jgi:5-(carboxyamino)imidazole ribonucleotide mutase
MPLVGIVIGSKSDAKVIQATSDALVELGIEHELTVLSAHRNPDKVRAYAEGAKERGIEVIIAAAGMAAALPGVLASLTTLPVIGVPLTGSALNGIDALYSIVQMPGGVPVGCMAIGKAGARNAAYYAAAILSLKHDKVRAAWEAFRKAQQGEPR